jgi:competence ComEA-like helix-hairpin-helix protein
MTASFRILSDPDVDVTYKQGRGLVDQRMLVLLCAAFCICLVHFFQFHPNHKQRPSLATNLANRVVWIFGEVLPGFYSIPASGIPYDSFLTALNISGTETENRSEKLFNPEKRAYELVHGQLIESTPVPSAATPFFYLPVSLNVSDQELLQTVPGIGEKLAQNIINYRKIKKFSSVAEILHVDGIGEKKFQKIRKYLTLEPPAK